ncbi:MAG: hypothetical protein ACRDRN_00480 [Sciscionella sp.]
MRTRMLGIPLAVVLGLSCAGVMPSAVAAPPVVGSNTFEGCTDGSALTAASSKTGGTPFDSVDPSGHLVYTTQQHMHGTCAIALHGPVGTEGDFAVWQNATAVDKPVFVRAYIRMHTLPSGADGTVRFLRFSDGSSVGIGGYTAVNDPSPGPQGSVALEDGYTSHIGVSKLQLKIDTWYRIEVEYDNVHLAMTAKIFNGDTRTALETVTNKLGTATKAIKDVGVGQQYDTSTNYNGDFVIDDVAFGTDWLGPAPATPPQTDPITDYYNKLGGAKSYLGTPVGSELSIPGGGLSRDYQGGTIYWSQATGAHVVKGSILVKYRALGGPTSALGYPKTDETATPDGYGRYNHFNGAAGYSIYWTPSTGAHEIGGAIRAKWASMGWEAGVLGYPWTDETGTPDGKGRFNHFSRNNGSIYWTPDTGAQEVQGAIAAKWASLKWERGPLGYPTDDESGTPDGKGRYNQFTGTGGASIYWTQSTGAHAVYGAIRAHWKALGWEQGPMGYPTTDERGTPDGIGRYNHFTGGDGASIYWTPSTGAWSVHGAIRDKWASMGWETSRLGYPTSDEYGVAGGRESRFQQGWISYYFAGSRIQVRYR